MVTTSDAELIIDPESLLLDHPIDPVSDWFTLSEKQRERVRRLHINYNGFCGEGLPCDLACFPNLRHLKIKSTRLWELQADRLPKTLIQLDMRGCINTDFRELNRLHEACAGLEVLALDADNVLGDHLRILQNENPDKYEDLPVIGPLSSLKVVISDEFYNVTEDDVLCLGDSGEAVRQRFDASRDRFLTHHKKRTAIDVVPTKWINSYNLQIYHVRPRVVSRVGR